MYPLLFPLPMIRFPVLSSLLHELSYFLLSENSYSNLGEQGKGLANAVNKFRKCLISDISKQMRNTIPSVL